MYFAAFGLLLLTFGGRFAAQEPDYTPPPPEMRYTITVEQGQEENGEAVTLVRLRGVMLQAPSLKGELGLSSVLTYDGVARTLRGAHVTFHSLAPRCRFPEEAAVNVVVDGERTLVGGRGREPAARGEGTVTISRVDAGGKCEEELALTLPPTLFLRMANASDVEVRAGSFKFGLGAPALKALWELAGRINAAEG